MKILIELPHILEKMWGYRRTVVLDSADPQDKEILDALQISQEEYKDLYHLQEHPTGMVTVWEYKEWRRSTERYQTVVRAQSEYRIRHSLDRDDIMRELKIGIAKELNDDNEEVIETIARQIIINRSVNLAAIYNVSQEILEKLKTLDIEALYGKH